MPDKEKIEFIDFSCPSCGVLLRVKRDKEAIKGKCPNCGEWVDIPKEK